MAGGNGTQNTTGSGAGTGWNYTGSVFYAGGEFNASAVYLGNYGGSYYVLTAYHISGTDNSQPTRGAGLGTFTIGTNNYSFSGAPVRISSMDLGNADLVVVKITPNDLAAQTYLDGLSNLSLSTSSPSLNTSVTMIGSGRNRATSQTTYYVDTDTNPYTWSTSPFVGSDATVGGYAWAAGNTKRWGSNTADSTSTANAGYGNTHVVITDFDAVSGEAQAATGDSGGGVYLSDGTLSGIMLYTGTFNGQPTETAVFGDATYYADISYYRSSILSAVPEPGTVGLMVVGAAALGGYLMHRRKPRR